MITPAQVTSVLDALGDQYLIDTVQGDFTNGFKLDYEQLVTFLTHPPQDFVDRITGYVNTRN